jgi:hypothetical protein
MRVMKCRTHLAAEVPWGISSTIDDNTSHSLLSLLTYHPSLFLSDLEATSAKALCGVGHTLHDLALLVPAEGHVISVPRVRHSARSSECRHSFVVLA